MGSKVAAVYAILLPCFRSHSSSIATNLNISSEPWIVGTSMTLTSGSITTVKPTDNTTIFVVVQGVAEVAGKLVIDLSGKNWNATYTVLSILRADSIVGGYATVGITNAKKSYVCTCMFFTPG